MVTLADVLVPGVGPVLTALKLICTAASEMHESQELCTRAYKMLAFIYEKMEAMQAKNTLPSDDILADYSDIVGEYCALLLKHQNKPWLYRVVTYKRVVAKVKEVQETVSYLMHALSMWHMEAMADERKLQEEFREQQVRFIEARLVDDATIAREVARMPQQIEALSVFRHELQQQPSPGSESDQRVVRTALDKVMRRSSVRVASVPEWFLPPHKVEFEKHMFARGSFGTVHHGKMGTVDVVVKCLLVDTRENERLTATFRREADLWFTFRHPHVVTMYGACDVSSPPFIVCEYAANSNLFNYLGSARNRPFTFKLLREAASGLVYLHDRRVVHGDLKCDNILVMGDGTAKIADFSFSYVRTLSMSKQSVADPMGGGRGGAMSKANASGALMWRAPECFEGRRPTTASDVYSFGMCIIEAVSGELPWGYHVDSVTVRELVKSGKLPDQPEFMSDRAWALVQRMCSFDPAKRPTMETVVRSLSVLATAEEEAAVAARHSIGGSGSTSGSIGGAASSRVGRFGRFGCSSNESDSNGPSDQLTASTIQLADEEREVLTDSPSEATSKPIKPLSVSSVTDEISGAEEMEQPKPVATTAPKPTNRATINENSDDIESSISIHEAAMLGQVDAIIAWLRRGVDIDKFARAGLYDLTHDERPFKIGTPLHFAAWYGQLEAARVLLEKGANADSQNRFSRCSALHYATLSGYVDIAHLLMRHGADVNVANDSSITPLHYTGLKGYADITRLLLQHGADMNAVDVLKHTPLYYAVTLWHPEVVVVLLENNADLGNEGETALCKAAARGHVGVVNTLFTRGVRWVGSP